MIVVMKTGFGDDDHDDMGIGDDDGDEVVW